MKKNAEEIYKYSILSYVPENILVSTDFNIYQKLILGFLFYKVQQYRSTKLKISGKNFDDLLGIDGLDIWKYKRDLINKGFFSSTVINNNTIYEINIEKIVKYNSNSEKKDEQLIKDVSSKKITYKIYKHTSPNGKVYIGITSLEPSRRWNCGKSYVGTTDFARDIEKYGWDNIEHKVLIETVFGGVAKMLERLLVRYFKSVNLCYNITDGGDYSHSFDDNFPILEATDILFIVLERERNEKKVNENINSRSEETIKNKLLSMQNDIIKNGVHKMSYTALDYYYQKYRKEIQSDEGLSNLTKNIYELIIST